MPLDREEYVEQAYFFQTLRERMQQSLSTQDLLDAIRQEILARGKAHFRTIADDQFCINEVLQTKYYDRIRILPCQYNFRAYLKTKCRGWPTVQHLDGVVIYHNSTCMDLAKKLESVKPRADVPSLPQDGRPLTPFEQFIRRLRNRFKPWIVK